MSRNLKRFSVSTARRLRHDMTDAERRLWPRRRRLPRYGTHFRRQVPIGPHVVDFACMAAHLVIEPDASQHAEAENIRRDEARTRHLESEGCKVIRFWNGNVANNLDSVVQTIYAALYGSLEAEPSALKHERRRGQFHPTPARSARRPSPSRGG